ncbi:hypothetical protein GQ53DRAFT_677823 [Thozetella sp. PMI_491]|nr:hypothetical protein GQ53DRAFT_677823 [Thozetella sp. PMI_491]
MHFSTVAAALLSVPGAHANLNQLAKAAGKLYFGTATDNGELTDTAYLAILSDANEFGQVTPGNTQKWQFTETSQGVFDYTKGDVITQLAQGNGQILRCHTLIWHQQLPTFVSSGSWTNETLAAVITAHIASEVGHYKGQCYSWDVVNEVVGDDGNFRNSIFFQTMGTSYIPLAFQAAAAADPGAKLYYNDFNIEQAGAKATKALEVVKLVQDAGARIDGVGLQGHFIVGSTPTKDALVSQLNAFTALGVEVAYTELDIRHSSLPANSANRLQQATDYTNVVDACLAVEKCVGVTVWDFDDKFSWVPSTFPGAGDACLFSSNLEAKPAYTSVSSLLSASASAAGAVITSAATTAVSPATTLVATTLATSIASQLVPASTATAAVTDVVSPTTESPAATETAVDPEKCKKRRRRVVTVVA